MATKEYTEQNTETPWLYGTSLQTIFPKIQAVKIIREIFLMFRPKFVNKVINELKIKNDFLRINRFEARVVGMQQSITSMSAVAKLRIKMLDAVFGRILQVTT